MSIYSKFFGQPSSHPLDGEHFWFNGGTYCHVEPLKNNNVIYKLLPDKNGEPDFNFPVFICLPYNPFWNMMASKSNQSAHGIPFELPFASTRFREKKVFFPPEKKEITLYVFDTIIYL